MANVFEAGINWMEESGFFNILIFMIALALFYTILKRVRILGESPYVNGAAALAMAFLVFGYPVVIGYSLVTPVAAMFAQFTVVLLVIGVALLIASYFHPDLQKFLADRAKPEERGWIWAGAAIAVGIALLSGVAQVLWNAPKGNAGMPAAPPELTVMAGIVIVLIIVLLIMSSFGGQPQKK
jgi:hypothetical protein